jgi:hypothetical protein
VIGVLLSNNTSTTRHRRQSVRRLIGHFFQGENATINRAGVVVNPVFADAGSVGGSVSGSTEPLVEQRPPDAAH